MLKWISKKRNKKGFTLIELVVVIAILGILIAIAVPRLAGFRESAQESADKATAATIAKAAEMYIASTGAEPTALEGKTNWISILVEEKLIDDNYKPQQEQDGEFELVWDDNRFLVKLGGVTLYPAE